MFTVQWLTHVQLRPVTPLGRAPARYDYDKQPYVTHNITSTLSSIAFYFNTIKLTNDQNRHVSLLNNITIQIVYLLAVVIYSFKVDLTQWSNNDPSKYVLQDEFTIAVGF